MNTASALPLSFFARDVLEVAPALLGTHLVRDEVVLRITEVEAYRWPGDTACHAKAGRTDRNAPLWGPAGLTYVYQCYGIHQMLNVVTGADGDAQAVLVRGCELVEGHDTVRARRGAKPAAMGSAALLAGPGKVGQALGIDTRWCNHALYDPRALWLRRGRAPEAIATGVRIGIDYAEPEHVALPWRFADADSAAVTHRKALVRG